MIPLVKFQAWENTWKEPTNQPTNQLTTTTTDNNFQNSSRLWVISFASG